MATSVSYLPQVLHAKFNYSIDATNKNRKILPLKENNGNKCNNNFKSCGILKKLNSTIFEEPCSLPFDSSLNIVSGIDENCDTVKLLNSLKVKRFEKQNVRNCNALTPDLLITTNVNKNVIKKSNETQKVNGKKLRPSKSFSRVEDLRRKFEFPSRLSKSFEDSKSNFINKSEDKNLFILDNSFQKCNSSITKESSFRSYILNGNVKKNIEKFDVYCEKSIHTKTQTKVIENNQKYFDINSNQKENVCDLTIDSREPKNKVESLYFEFPNYNDENKKHVLDGTKLSINVKDSDQTNNLVSSVQKLRKSIFSSLKLPRKASMKMSSQHLPGRDTLGSKNFLPSVGSATLGSNSSSKRKSAVELLAESKAFYVKSETVLDRKQELPLRVHSTLSTGSNSGTHYATLSGRHRRNGTSEPLQNQLRRLLGSTSSQSPCNAYEGRSQTLRYTGRNNASNRDWDPIPQPHMMTRSQYMSGTYSGNSSSGTSGSKGHAKSDPEQSTSAIGCYSSKSLNRPSSSGDNRIFFPDSFVVPKPSRSDPANVFSNSFSIESPFSSPEKIDTRQILSVIDAYESYGRPETNLEYYDDGNLIENYTISPPAEYAVTERSNYRYTRSNSHSHTIKTQDSTYAANFNSHKSLPDLHRQADHNSENGRQLANMAGNGQYLPSCDVGRNIGMGIQSQGVRSSEALSNYSKAMSGRSYRSPAISSKGSDGYSRRSASGHNSDFSGHTGKGSTDEIYFYNRSGSSYARDSGGSSGHCSGPLGPPSLRGVPVNTNISLQQRRDSGSSTQHSSTRSHRYSSYYMDRYQNPESNDLSHLEYRVSAPLQFQDGVQFNHGPNNNQLAVNATVSISTNFGACNDGFRAGNTHVEPQTSERPALVGIHFQASIPPVQFQDSQPSVYFNGSYSTEGFYGHRESGNRESRHLLTRRPASSGCNQVDSTCYDDDREGVHSLPHEVEGSPPSLSGLGNFKRQRCLRYKHRSSPRRPILRSKSDISDRYWRDDKVNISINSKPHNTPPSSDNNSPNRDAQVKLDKFFDQLGMDDETYKDVILKDLKKPRKKQRSKSSPSHDSKKESDSNSKESGDEANDELSSSFASSEISFPDSNLIPNNADYTLQGGQNDKPYRSYEPVSIVERNARIIKWLCNCRKLQAV